LDEPINGLDPDGIEKRPGAELARCAARIMGKYLDETKEQDISPMA
jgi:hypothetical protein